MAIHQDLMAELAKLRAENEALKLAKANAKPFGLKVSEKGAVSCYGMGRFPVTLYAEQWTRLLDKADEIKAFIAQNKSRLSYKD